MLKNTKYILLLREKEIHRQKQHCYCMALQLKRIQEQMISLHDLLSSERLEGERARIYGVEYLRKQEEYRALQEAYHEELFSMQQKKRKLQLLQHYLDKKITDHPTHRSYDS